MPYFGIFERDAVGAFTVDQAVFEVAEDIVAAAEVGFAVDDYAHNRFGFGGSMYI